jgi:hypothetical protein
MDEFSIENGLQVLRHICFQFLWHEEGWMLLQRVIVLRQLISLFFSGFHKQVLKL